MSGCKAVPTPRCDVERRNVAGVRRQQIHIHQISRLTASIYEGFYSPPTTRFFFFFFKANVDLIYVSQFINQMPRQMYVNISSLPLSST